MNLSKKYFLVLFLSGFYVSNAFSQGEFNAVVVDLESREILPFSIVSVNNDKIKADSEGSLSVLNPAFPLSICIDYLGYKDTCLVLLEHPKQVFYIELQQDVVHLSEVSIRPYTPVEYIQESKKLFRQNYANDEFQTVSSYEDWFAEDQRTLLSREVTLKTSFNHYLDSLKPECHQILSFVGSDSIGEIAFMKAKLEKIAAKEKRKAEEKGEDFVALQDLTTMASGPDLIYYLSIDHKNIDCFDSVKFKKFEYQFDEGHEGLSEVAIVFKSKNKVNHVRQSGRLVYDSKTLALKELSFVGNVVVPAIYKPILWIAGFSIKSPVIEVTVRFQEREGLWYPLFCFWHAQGSIKKRYLFKKNEQSLFDISQKVIVKSLILGEGVVDIPEKKQYDFQQKMSEQVFPELVE